MSGAVDEPAARGLLVRCGATDPDPRTEARIAAARQAIGSGEDATGCGRLMRMHNAFRCVECGRWFHRACALRHFERERPRTLAGHLAAAAAHITAAQALSPGGQTGVRPGSE